MNSMSFFLRHLTVRTAFSHMTHVGSPKCCPLPNGVPASASLTHTFFFLYTSYMTHRFIFPWFLGKIFGRFKLYFCLKLPALKLQGDPKVELCFKGPGITMAAVNHLEFLPCLTVSFGDFPN